MRLTFGATLYNEEASVPHITNLVFQVLKRFPDDQFVFVDNGSTDRTHFMLSSAFQAIDKSAQKGVIKKNNAARKKSRLSKLVK